MTTFSSRRDLNLKDKYLTKDIILTLMHMFLGISYIHEHLLKHIGFYRMRKLDRKSLEFFPPLCYIRHNILD